MSYNFKIGDRVECLKDFEGYPSKGKTGTVIYIGNLLGLEMDECIGTSHGVYEKCRYGYGFMIPPKLVKPEIRLTPSEDKSLMASI